LDDLKVSDLLYKNGYYPAAIFHLEQATEKLIKSCGI
jgi:HEPN domain-containing protein